ncbi:folate-binding protein YgfZ [Beggiatoa alba B18LD]|uniref:Folate-binding protein YgfZ n=1 Tax=Beggiatoa alba B18LD TaxID=395493 RepID=I3CL17_9GAMM|nr:folate-binding protein YgfZ [Beggiatoa alba]EIJ44310.1 folate-binding protein YgfZ [Beggiatoa alba B18LD]
MEQWTQFLQQKGAQWDARNVLNFGQPNVEQQAVLTQDVLMDLSAYGLLQVTGNDAEKFLQGQFTNDVRQVNGQRSQLSAWCNAKGRVLYTFHLIKRNNDYLIFLPYEGLEAVQKRLKMFVLRADVQFTDVSEQLVSISIAGNHSVQYLSEALGFAVPQESNMSITQGQYTVVRIAGQTPRYLVIADSETQCQTWQTLTAKSVRAVGSSAWQLLNILAGIPQITTNLADQFVPQMLNYQAIGGINFKKGCYAGQEIVARMQYLATLKQRLYLIRLPADCTPQIGDDFYGVMDVQSIGKLVNVQAHPEGGYIGLAVLSIEQAESNPVSLQKVGGATAQLLNLPYDPSATMAA